MATMEVCHVIHPCILIKNTYPERLQKRCMPKCVPPMPHLYLSKKFRAKRPTTDAIHFLSLSYLTHKTPISQPFHQHILRHIHQLLSLIHFINTSLYIFINNSINNRINNSINNNSINNKL